MHRRLLAASLAIAFVACSSRSDDAQPSAQPKQGVATVTKTTAPGDTAAARASVAASVATDSLLARARAALRSAMPDFREWTDSAAITLPEGADAASFRAAEVVGDFDEDGAPDVAFIGRDSDRERIVAVLSQHGHPSAVPVTGFGMSSAADSTRRRWFRRATVEAHRPRVGLEVVERADDGEIKLPATRYVFVDGHFTEWIDGE